MNLSFGKKWLLSVVAMVVLFSAQAQTVFYTQDFANGIPASWSNVGGVTTPGFGTHQWANGTIATAPSWGSQPDFASTTVTNGFAFFNAYPNNTSITYDTKLTTAAINCTGRTNVWLRFESQYAFYSASSVVEVGVSTDSINFTYSPILGNVQRNALTDAVQIVEVDLTAKAANQAKVFVQFRWRGVDEYDWKIDDITLATGSLKPKNNTKIQWAIRPFYYDVPEFQKQPVVLGAYVANIGRVEQKNVKLTTTVKDQANTTVYTGDATLPRLEVDSIRLIEVNAGFTPPATGTYTISYTLTQDSIDNEPVNNTATEVFKVGATAPAGNLYSLATATANDGNILANGIPGSAGNFNNEAVAAVYYIPNGSSTATNYYLDSIVFRAVRSGSASTLVGKTINLFVYKWNDANSDQIIDAGELGGQSTGETYVGAAEYTFDATFNGTGATYFTPNIGVAIPDFTGTGVIKLQANTYYVVTIEQTTIAYNANDRFFIAETVNQIDFEGIATYNDEKGVGKVFMYQVKQSGDWRIPDFKSQPHMSMKVRKVDSSVGIQNANKAKFALSVYPNPTTETLNWDIKLNNTAKEVTYQIADMMGRVVFSTKKSDIMNDKFVLDVTNFANGNYNLTIITPEGIRTERFTVTK